MTEIEIENFALNFTNLISNKNAEIGKLTTENKRLKAELNERLSHGGRLHMDDIRLAKRAVYCFHIKPISSRDNGFWAVPLDDRSGVIGPNKGVLRYENYGKTWYAMPEKPEA